MFAAPFETTTAENPFYQPAERSKISLDDIVDALQTAKKEILQGKVTSRIATPEPALPPIVDLRNETHAYIVAERLFANGKAYRPVTQVTLVLDDAKRDLKTQTRKLASRAVDPESVKLEILRLRFEGPWVDDAPSSSDEEDNDDNGSDDTLVGRMPVGADVIDSSIPHAEEAQKFEHSFNHFDDDLDCEAPENQDVPPKEHIDKWFQTPKRSFS